MEEKPESIVFDYRALRLLMGFIALAMPIIVTILSSETLSSISASYYTEARDAFVGMLFIVSAFLWAYNGHKPLESVASKVASLAAILVALSPTTCNLCETDTASIIHSIATATLFSILVYFCFSPFRRPKKVEDAKRGLRKKIYFVCGWVMIACMLSMFSAKILLTKEMIYDLRIMYFAEAFALGAFGVAWIVAGKWLWFLVGEEVALKLYKKKLNGN